jgi:pimeloyl-ACP methyl ester carboxylesterase
LLDTLKIAKADILGWFMGSYIAQELTLTNPDKVSNLILYASGCGGQILRPQVLNNRDDYQRFDVYTPANREPSTLLIFN